MLALNEQRLEDLEKTLKDLGQASFRGRQLFEYFHKQLGKDLDTCSTLPKSLRENLGDLPLKSVDIAHTFTSKKDQTKKFLFRLEDQRLIEGVLMKNNYGYSQCISTQVGCRMGCHFCASTKNGLVRNLSPYEMLGQIYETTRRYGKIHSIILMGSGEPLDNLENVLIFMDILNSPLGYPMSYRNMTLSTCGLVPEILQLAHQDRKVNLALSLHSPFQKVREGMMPIAKRYDLKEIFQALDQYTNQLGRRVSYEYTLIDGVNNREEDLEELKKLLKNRLHHLNLIPLNPIDEYGEDRPERAKVLYFQKRCEDMGLNVTIRREQGGDINASCGQLRQKFEEEEGL